MANIILSMQGIKKAFNGVPALKNGALDLYEGEVHALMGENGAGKSTLMKILTGIYARDEGRVYYDGKDVVFNGPAESEAAGIAIVHQELNMMKDLTVAQNLFIGHESMNGMFIDDKAMEEKAKELFKILNVDIDPSVKVGMLTVGKQQMVEIAKVISKNAKVIVLDEPTAALTDHEIEELFRVIRDLKSKGAAIVYISHRMDEINVISDRITVMRDGEYVGVLDAHTCTKDDIIKMMVGRTVFIEPKTKSQVPEGAKVLLRCEHLNRGKFVQDVSFEVHAGEIIGFSGLMGAGRTETARLIFGADKMDSGKIFIDGKEVAIKSPKDAVAHGIGYLSEDRKRFGLLVDKSVEENTVIASLSKFISSMNFIDQNKTEEVSKEYVKELKTKTPSVKQIIKKLSGGNQQKVVIAKWLSDDSDILIFDEPTRGIDVGAKSEIYALMETLAKQGKAIIMISSELPEILRMSDRVAVMCEGKLTGILPIEECTQEKIMALATRQRLTLITAQFVLSLSYFAIFLAKESKLNQLVNQFKFDTTHRC